MKQVYSISWRRRLAVMILGFAWGVMAGNLKIASAQENLSPPKSPAAKPQREWNWKTGDEVYQLLTVEKRPSFKVQGLPFESKIRFKILSKLTMRISPLDQSLTIKQKVETTKLEEADDLSKTLLTKMLQDLTGKTITIRLNAEGEVARIEGVPEPVAQAGMNGLDFRGALLSSLIDRDGWKELTLATIFTPPLPLTEGAKWRQPISHAWGALGSWRGQSAYQYQGLRENLATIGYAHDLTYQAPALADNTLPFKIAHPMFRVKEAQGTLRYDAGKGRLASMEEKFHVIGQMMIQVAGQNFPLQLEEIQNFHLELFDKKPAADKR